MDKELKRLISAANRASEKTRWGHYPMAPSIGLNEREIRLHAKAEEAHAIAREALQKAGLKEDSILHDKASYNHSLVTSRVGNF